MTKELVKFQNEDWYKSLIDDCQSIITEAVHISRYTLVVGHWSLGKRIRRDKNVKEFSKGNKSFVQDLARHLNMSERTVYYSLQAYDKYPNLDDIPEGKNISWNKLIIKHLTEGKKEKVMKDDLIECPQCGYKWTGD